MRDSHQANAAIPRPDVMPIDREAWARELHSFRIIDAYRNTEWLPSYNFVLASSRHAR